MTNVVSALCAVSARVVESVSHMCHVCKRRDTSLIEAEPGLNRRRNFALQMHDLDVFRIV